MDGIISPSPITASDDQIDILLDALSEAEIDPGNTGLVLINNIGFQKQEGGVLLFFAQITAELLKSPPTSRSGDSHTLNQKPSLQLDPGVEEAILQRCTDGPSRGQLSIEVTIYVEPGGCVQFLNCRNLQLSP